MVVPPTAHIEDFFDLSRFRIDHFFFEGIFGRIAVIAPIFVDQANQLLANFNNRARNRGDLSAFGIELRKKFGTKHGQKGPEKDVRTTD